MKINKNIPFNKLFLAGNEINYIKNAIKLGHLSGDNFYTIQSQKKIESLLGVSKALLTHSCTAALEMAAILIDIKEGDEVIMPSYTFVSTANAFVLRGAVPVFVDIRKDTSNINESEIEYAITSKTKAIVVVHYAGVSCDMDRIMKIANKNKLFVIEDAAQAILSKYKKKFLGSIGHLSAISFHETKNIISGEGGALLINDKSFFERAEIIREKGTNRSQFINGCIDKYTWVDIGSSYLPSELTAAFLLAQLEESINITKLRMSLWKKYHVAFQDVENLGFVKRPEIPSGCKHNAHMYYLIVKNEAVRNFVIKYLKKYNIIAAFHYIPLHSSPFGIAHCVSSKKLFESGRAGAQIIRLPLWPGLENKIDRIIKFTKEALTKSQDF